MCALWTACVGVGINRILDDDLVARDLVLVITDKAVYWLAMTCAVLVLCALPTVAGTYVQTKVARARLLALIMVWCVLDVYTLYLVHELTVTIAEYSDNAPNSTFGDKWHETTSIPDNSTNVCDQEDAELKKYGLLYQNQVSPVESQRFKCAFELHEAIRLNFLCAVVAWTIYRISTHGRNGVGIVVTAMVFVAISTAVDDLRSYWVLGTEQAAFLSSAAVLDALGELRSDEETNVAKIDIEPDSARSRAGLNAIASQQNAKGAQEESQSEISLLLPRPGATIGMRLDF